MPGPRQRFRRIAKWIGAVLGANIFVAWILSVPTIRDARLVIQRLDSRSERSLELGTLRWASIEQPLIEEPVWDAGWDVGGIDKRDREHYGMILPQRIVDSSVDTAYLPLWLPFLMVALPTALLWYRDRRRPPPGYCPNCNYNLTGNTSDICPECGTPRTPQNESAQSAVSQD